MNYNIITPNAKHSTWAGKFYNTFFDCFRLLFLVSIVDNTFGGDEAALECDTQGTGRAITVSGFRVRQISFLLNEKKIKKKIKFF